MDYSEEELKEFKVEAFELLSDAETRLLNIEKGDDFQKNYSAIFRAFHSIKGAAGMLGLVELQNHMHKIESLFSTLKEVGVLSNSKITFFLNAIDCAYKIVNLEPVNFNYEFEKISATEEVAGQNIPKNENAEVLKPVISIDPNKINITHLNSTKDTVFIIDDESLIVDLLADMLDGLNLEIKKFTNPLLAIEELKKKKPSLILTDMKMPELSGLDVLKAVNEFDSDIPVIFISAYLSKEILFESIELGVFGVIEKPFNNNVIVSTTLNALDKYKTIKLLNKTIDIIMFQFNDLEEVLKAKKKEHLFELIKVEIYQLLSAKRQLKKNKVNKSGAA